MTPEEKQLYIILDDVLVDAMSKATPGLGRNVANAWEIQYENGDFYLVNNYGMVAKFLDEGVKPHLILPKTKKMLRFELKRPPVLRQPEMQEKFNEKGVIFFFKNKEPVLGFVREGGKYFCFAKKVQHPGYEGRHFISTVLDNPKIWDKIFDEYFKAIQ